MRPGECHGETGWLGDGLGIAARRRLVFERNLDWDLLGSGTRGTARNRSSRRSRTGQISERINRPQDEAASGHTTFGGGRPWENQPAGRRQVRP